MKKLTLSLDSLEVQSFVTADNAPGRGTVRGEQCTCPTACTCPGCPTCPDTCQATCDGETCGEFTCDSCGDSCMGTCEKTCQTMVCFCAETNIC